jgi:protein-tyrosine phosphatase
MPATIPWQPNESCDQVIRHLARGDCVALPTESTYEIVASALHPTAVDRLSNLGAAPAVVLGDYAALFDWLPLASGAGARLFRKLGPGPVALSADAGFRFGAWSHLPESVRGILARSGRLTMRWPAHAIWKELRHADLPLVSAALDSAKIPGEAIGVAGDAIACVVDAGATELGIWPSDVQVQGRRCRMVREGGLSAELLDKLTLCRILFVCTGNTCRSPLAQALCSKLLADRLGVPASELQQHGFLVQSAGLAAMMGADASPDSVTVATELGADLSTHKSAMATLEMLQWADHVFAMTMSHWYTLASAVPPGAVQPRMLSPKFEDIADPIGAALVDYRTCAQQILECLQQRVPELLES